MLQRLVSLDAYRGAIMLLMASSGFGIPQVAKNFPDSALWEFLGHQFDHAAWTGCTLWDLIQPAFMFMVGVALPWSIANRQARGQSFGLMFSHAVWRAVLLVLLAVFLTSAWSKQTEWVFTNVLGQIGLGYTFLFLFAFTKPNVQWLAAAGLLFAYWTAFALHPLPRPGFDWNSVGVPDHWPHLAGLAAHWEKNANFAATFDRFRPKTMDELARSQLAAQDQLQRHRSSEAALTRAIDDTHSAPGNFIKQFVITEDPGC
jgi:hypothetical protein